MKEARRIHESLKSMKDDTFATLVSRSMPRGRRAPLHDGTRVREGTARVAVGEHHGLAVLVRRVIVARVKEKTRATSKSNMRGKRRRHRFSAFWLIGSNSWYFGILCFFLTTGSFAWLILFNT